MKEEKTTTEGWEEELDSIIRKYYGFRDIINNEEEMVLASIDEIKSLLSSALLQERQRMVEMIVSWDFSEDGACVLISEKKNGVVTVLQESRLTNGAINLSLLSDKEELKDTPHQGRM